MARRVTQCGCSPRMETFIPVSVVSYRAHTRASIQDYTAFTRGPVGWRNGREVAITGITSWNSRGFMTSQLPTCFSLLQKSLGNCFAQLTFIEWLLVLGSVLSNLSHLILMSALYVWSVLSLTSFYRWGNRCIVRLGNSPEVIQWELEKGREPGQTHFKVCTLNQ